VEEQLFVVELFEVKLLTKKKKVVAEWSKKKCAAEKPISVVCLFCCC
jgi:hypothetical protein